jgi:hypothetical protein
VNDSPDFHQDSFDDDSFDALPSFNSINSSDHSEEELTSKELNDFNLMNN